MISLADAHDIFQTNTMQFAVLFGSETYRITAGICQGRDTEK